MQWAESQKPCNRLKLVDLIVKPFQRLTKYKLLLYAMRKPLDKMEVTTDVEEQKKDISVMVRDCNRNREVSTVPKENSTNLFTIAQSKQSG